MAMVDAERVRFKGFPGAYDIPFPRFIFIVNK